MEKEQLKQEIIETFKKLSTLQKQFKEQFEDEELGLDIADELVADVKYTYVSNDFPDVYRQNEQWVGLSIETYTGLKFHFNFLDLDDVDEVTRDLSYMRDFVEEKNENWTPEDLEENEN